jgi:hypothetical protein
LDNVDLGENNSVLNGSVGNTKRDGQVQMKKNASVPAPGFVKASQIHIDNPSNVPNRILGQVMVTLPTMQFATTMAGLRNVSVPANATATLTGNYNDVEIGKNAVVTLTGSIFHNVSMDDGAKATFTAAVLNMNDLEVGSSGNGGSSPTKMIFSTDCAVRVHHTHVRGNCQVNPTSKSVVFYAADNFDVDGANTWVIASVYAPDHDINVESNGNSTVHMTGRFIAKHIQSDNNVVWNSYDCSNPPPPLFAPVTPEPDQFTSAPSLELRAYPNPSENGFNLVLKNQTTEEVMVRVLDLSGKVMKTFRGTPDQLFRVGDDLKPGMYIAEVMQGGQKTMVKLIKQQ